MEFHFGTARKGRHVFYFEKAKETSMKALLQNRLEVLFLARPKAERHPTSLKQHGSSLRVGLWWGRRLKLALRSGKHTHASVDRNEKQPLIERETKSPVYLLPPKLLVTVLDWH